MSDVKWIKITTDIFDDEKILLIESMPSPDSIIVIWFKLLTLAGKQNNDGVFMMSNRIAYTDEMLASIFRRDLNTVRMALNVFEQFGMVEIINNVITIPNWNKHQTLDAYEKKKQRDRLYQAERRANQRALIEKSSDTSPDKSSDVAISEEEKEEEKEKEKDILPKGNTKKKPEKRRYGEYQHVLLTDNEYENIANSFGIPMRDKAIRFLDEYIEEKGYKSKSHNLAIRRWVIQAVQEQEAKEGKKQGYSKGRKEPVPGWMQKEDEAPQKSELDSMKAYLAKLKGENTVGNNPELAARAEALKRDLSRG